MTTHSKTITHPQLELPIDKNTLVFFRLAAIISGERKCVDQETLFVAIALYSSLVCDFTGRKLSQLPADIVSVVRKMKVPRNITSPDNEDIPLLDGTVVDMLNPHDISSPIFGRHQPITLYAVAFSLLSDPDEGVFGIMYKNKLFCNFNKFKSGLKNRFAAGDYLPRRKKAMRSREAARFMEDFLVERMPGQKRAIKEIVSAVQDFWTNGGSDNRPLVIVLAGKKGCGKSHLSSLIQEAFIRLCLQSKKTLPIDASVLTDREGQYLLGSDVHYTNTREGILSEVLSKEPRSCLVFDNVLSANIHQDYRAALLSFVGGNATDRSTLVEVASGHCLCIINVSLTEGQDFYVGEKTKSQKISAELLSATLNPKKSKEEEDDDDHCDPVLKAASKIIMLDPITEKELIDVARKHLLEISRELSEDGISVDCDDVYGYIKLHLHSTPALPNPAALCRAISFDFSQIRNYAGVKHVDICVDCLPVYTYGENTRASRGDALECNTVACVIGEDLLFKKTNIRYVRKAVASPFTIGMKDVRFEDLVGVDDAKDKLRDAIDYVKHASDYARRKIPCPGINFLFYGLPGTGKTSLAIAAANEAGLPYFVATSSALKSVDKVRHLFAEAHKAAPAIVILEEFNTIGSARYGGHIDVINELNSLLDGVKRKSNLVIVASTNYLEQVEPSLLRGGRFGEKVEIPLPNAEAAEKILIATLHRYNVPCSEEIKRAFLEMASGKSAADLVSDLEVAVFRYKLKGIPIGTTLLRRDSGRGKTLGF